MIPSGEFQVKEGSIRISEYPAILTTLWVASLNNDADLEVAGSSNGKTTYRMVGDPTEGALIVAAEKAGASVRELNEAYPRRR